MVEIGGGGGYPSTGGRQSGREPINNSVDPFGPTAAKGGPKRRCLWQRNIQHLRTGHIEALRKDKERDNGIEHERWAARSSILQPLSSASPGTHVTEPHHKLGTSSTPT